MTQYIDERQVSQITGVSIQTLRNWRHQGRGFPYSKTGRCVRYRLDDVISFMESRKIRTDGIEPQESLEGV